MSLYFCQNGASMNQMFSLTKTGQLRRESFCAFGSNVEGSILKMRSCSNYGVQSEKWTHSNDGLIVNSESGKYIHICMYIKLQMNKY